MSFAATLMAFHNFAVFSRVAFRVLLKLGEGRVCFAKPAAETGAATFVLTVITPLKTALASGGLVAPSSPSLTG